MIAFLIAAAVVVSGYYAMVKMGWIGGFGWPSPPE